MVRIVVPMPAAGTIVVAVGRQHFAVVVADRLYHGHDALGRLTQGTHDKIVLHRILPLVLATAGFAFLPPDGRPTTGDLRAVAESIKRPADLDVAAIADRFKHRFLEIVRACRREMTADQLDKAKIDVFVAVVRKGEASVARLRLTDDQEFIENPPLSAPSSLETFYSGGRYADDAEVYGDRFANGPGLARHLKRVVADGIAAEAALNGGSNLEVGGGIDIAIVDKTGARFIPA